MRGWLVVLGVLALAVGVWGIYDEYFVVVEFFKGAVQPLTALGGLVAILAGLLSRKPRTFHVVAGLVLLAIGVYGFFDEYFAVLDFFKGAVPPILLLAGVVAVVTGVKHMKLR